MNVRTNRTTLGFETLEAREVPAIVGVTNTPTFVLIQANDNGSSLTIERETSNSKLVIKEAQTGKSWTFSSSLVGHDHVVFVGGAGSDWANASGARIKVTLHGMGGNDLLVGGGKSDKILGGNGNDYIIGGGGADNLYGRGGKDQLYGQGGSDFLDDGGQTGDKSDGGDGDDFLARKPVRFGTSPTDVNQEQTPTCWVLAPLSAAASEGINLASRITYMGNGEYRVKLLNEDGGHSYQYVNLEGGRLGFEPDPQGDESWVILFHRAMMQELDVDWKDPDAYSGGQCWEVMPMLTGRPASQHTAYGWEFTLSFLQDMRNALIQDKLVCAGTRQGNFNSGNILGSVSTPKLVGSHCYHVLNVNFDTNQVTLRNPWGVDGGSGSGDSTDGIVKISLVQFMESMDTVGIS